MWPSQGLTQVTNLPMMITFTFNGAVNDENVRVYDRLFHGGPFTNYFITLMHNFIRSYLPIQVKDWIQTAALRKQRSLCRTSTPTTPRSKSCTGRATRSVYSRSPTRTTPSTGRRATMTPGWQRWPAAGQFLKVFRYFLTFPWCRLIIERFANISDGTVVGVRAPFLRVSPHWYSHRMTSTRRSEATSSSTWWPTSTLPTTPPSPLLSAGFPSGLTHCSTGNQLLHQLGQKMKKSSCSGCLTSATATLATARHAAIQSGRCRSTSLIEETIPTLTRTSLVAISSPPAATSTTRTSSGILWRIEALWLCPNNTWSWILHDHKEIDYKENLSPGNCWTTTLRDTMAPTELPSPSLSTHPGWSPTRASLTSSTSGWPTLPPLTMTFTSPPSSKLSNGCRTPQELCLSGTLRSGKESARWRVNPSAACPTRAPWQPESCLERPWGCTHAWSAPTTTPGSKIQLAMDSPSEQSRCHQSASPWKFNCDQSSQRCLFLTSKSTWSWWSVFSKDDQMKILWSLWLAFSWLLKCYLFKYIHTPTHKTQLKNCFCLFVNQTFRLLKEEQYNKN